MFLATYILELNIKKSGDFYYQILAMKIPKKTHFVFLNFNFSFIKFCV